ncbi:hypothetical protein [Streptomyces sp. x-80]|uniref:hypothetical protein n=1 Tax=Streptomyces sp. x-80 TaxID=2789282 RepID=UPI00397ECEA9
MPATRQVLHGITRREYEALALLLIGYIGMAAAALTPSPWLFAAACVSAYVADGYLHLHTSSLLRKLGKARTGLTVRFLVRTLFLLVLLAREGHSGTTLFTCAVAGMALWYGLQAPHSALVQLITWRRRLPVVTRNIDLSDACIPDAPPAALRHRAALKMLHTDVFATAGLVAAVCTGSTVPGIIGVALTLITAMLYTLALLPYAVGRHAAPDSEAVVCAVNDWLRRYRPSTALYFSGAKDSLYQVEMWLNTMERLEVPAVVLLRERHLANKLPPTNLPVLCVPSATLLMALDLSPIRVALYSANVGKNIHLLRVPTIKHVFIGHGDSDKAASINPYTKVYDEIWTAGRAGRDRYALAEVGVRDDSIVEVGRPQLDALRPWSGPPRGRIPTVLYAPTWEGWDGDPGSTSLLAAGENVVRELLEADAPVRVLYRPHPFTGIRDPRAKAAHLRIVTAIEAAAARRAADPRWMSHRSGGIEAQRKLALTETCLKGLRPAERTMDEAQLSRDAAKDPARAWTVAELRERWETLYWQAAPDWEHRVIPQDGPRLYSCFNAADALVSDISSVVSDFIATLKPYAVVDAAGVGAGVMKRQNTACRAGTIVGPRAEGMSELLAALRDPKADIHAAERQALRDYLLGPDEDAFERFQAEVRRLTDTSRVRASAVLSNL